MHRPERWQTTRAKTAIAAALQNNDVAGAEPLPEALRQDMEADDLLQTTGLITKEMDLRVGTSAATEAMGRWAQRSCRATWTGSPTSCWPWSRRATVDRGMARNGKHREGQLWRVKMRTVAGTSASA